jgi:hypothetical protein
MRVVLWILHDMSHLTMANQFTGSRKDNLSQKVYKFSGPH